MYIKYSLNLILRLLIRSDQFFMEEHFDQICGLDEAFSRQQQTYVIVTLDTVVKRKISSSRADGRTRPDWFRCRQAVNIALVWFLLKFFHFSLQSVSFFLGDLERIMP